MKKQYFFIMLLSIIILLSGCSKLNNKIQQPQNITVDEKANSTETVPTKKVIILKYTPPAKLPTNVLYKEINEINKENYTKNKFYYTNAYVIRITDCVNANYTNCIGEITISNINRNVTKDNHSDNELILKFNSSSETEMYLKDIKINEKYKFSFKPLDLEKNGSLYGRFLGLDFLENKNDNYIIMKHENGDDNNIKMSKNECDGKWGSAIFINENNKELEYCVCSFLGGVILEGEMKKCLSPE